MRFIIEFVQQKDVATKVNGSKSKGFDAWRYFSLQLCCVSLLKKQAGINFA